MLVTYVIQQTVLFPLHIVWKPNLGAVIEDCLIKLETLDICGYSVVHITILPPTCPSIVTVLTVKIKSMFQMKPKLTFPTCTPTPPLFLIPLKCKCGLEPE